MSVASGVRQGFSLDLDDSDADSPRAAARPPRKSSADTAGCSVSQPEQWELLQAAEHNMIYTPPEQPEPGGHCSAAALGRAVPPTCVVAASLRLDQAGCWARDLHQMHSLQGILQANLQLAQPLDAELQF